MSETQRYAPVAMNGAYTMNAKCESKKKPFTSEVEAVEFEKWNRETNGYQRQYAYKCEDCPDWHLTSTPPGAATMARTNYSAIANLNPIREKGETKAKVRELASQGLKAKEIAERLTISTAAVY